MLNKSSGGSPSLQAERLGNLGNGLDLRARASASAGVVIIVLSVNSTGPNQTHKQEVRQKGQSAPITSRICFRLTLQGMIVSGKYITYHLV
jgi:hypothetical protein